MRILLVKTSSLGDVIHNLPVVSDLVAWLPDAMIDWVVEESFAEIPRLHPKVNKVIPVAIRRWRSRLFSPDTWREIAVFRQQLRSENYDFVIDTQGLLKSALITRLAKGVRCGYDSASARESLASIAYDRKFTVPASQHAVTRNRLLAALATANSVTQPLDYGIAGRLPGAVARPNAVLLTATSRDDKLWPEPHWIALGNRLNHLGLACKLPAGSPVERDRASRLAAAIPNAFALPAMSLTDLAQTLASAQVVIGVDTGLVHLAAALGRPTVALFCASDPILTGVYASTPLVNLGARHDPPTVAAVLDAATAFVKMRENQD